MRRVLLLCHSEAFSIGTMWATQPPSAPSAHDADLLRRHRSGATFEFVSSAPTRRDAGRHATQPPSTVKDDGAARAAWLASTAMRQRRQSATLVPMVMKSHVMPADTIPESSPVVPSLSLTRPPAESHRVSNEFRQRVPVVAEASSAMMSAVNATPKPRGGEEEEGEAVAYDDGDDDDEEAENSQGTEETNHSGATNSENDERGRVDDEGNDNGSDGDDRQSGSFELASQRSAPHPETGRHSPRRPGDRPRHAAKVEAARRDRGRSPLSHEPDDDTGDEEEEEDAASEGQVTSSVAEHLDATGQRRASRGQPSLLIAAPIVRRVSGCLAAPAAERGSRRPSTVHGDIRRGSSVDAKRLAEELAAFQQQLIANELVDTVATEATARQQMQCDEQVQGWDDLIVSLSYYLEPPSDSADLTTVADFDESDWSISRVPSVITPKRPRQATEDAAFADAAATGLAVAVSTAPAAVGAPDPGTSSHRAQHDPPSVDHVCSPLLENFMKSWRPLHTLNPLGTATMQDAVLHIAEHTHRGSLEQQEAEARGALRQFHAASWLSDDETKCRRLLARELMLERKVVILLDGAPPSRQVAMASQPQFSVVGRANTARSPACTTPESDARHTDPRLTNHSSSPPGFDTPAADSHLMRDKGGSGPGDVASTIDPQRLATIERIAQSVEARWSKFRHAIEVSTAELGLNQQEGESIPTAATLANGTLRRRHRLQPLSPSPTAAVSAVAPLNALLVDAALGNFTSTLLSDEDAARRWFAAVKIQALYRGHSCRSNVVRCWTLNLQAFTERQRDGLLDAVRYKCHGAGFSRFAALEIVVKRQEQLELDREARADRVARRHDLCDRAVRITASASIARRDADQRIVDDVKQLKRAERQLRTRRSPPCSATSEVVPHGSNLVTTCAASTSNRGNRLGGAARNYGDDGNDTRRRETTGGVVTSSVGAAPLRSGGVAKSWVDRHLASAHERWQRENRW